MVIANIASSRCVVRLAALTKCKNKLTIREINSIHEKKIDFDILDISIGQNSSTAFVEVDVQLIRP